MKNLLLLLGPGALLVTAFAVVRATPSASLPETPVTASAPATAKAFDGGARTLDELVQQLLEALRKNDKPALHALRVTESEYRDIIMPGNVEPGQPPQDIRTDVFDYFWGSLNEKSLIYELYLFEQFGGRPYTLVEAKNSGEHQWAGFKSYRRLRITVKDEQGAEVEIATGSAAELDGHLKFISFIRD